MNLSVQYPNLMLPVRAIPLTHGQVAIVDPEDWSLVGSYEWRAMRDRKLYYAYTSVRSSKTRDGWATLRMHTLITGYSQTDHINGNGLDCRRINLRETTNTENIRNSNLRCDTTSGYKGVSWSGSHSSWMSRITVSGHTIVLGYFLTSEDAARAYDKAAIKYFGEFARTNAMLGLLNTYGTP